MALGARILELQQAMSAYGETAARHYLALHEFGDALVAHFPAYLGEGATVLGVPPESGWALGRGDYRDAKFSSFKRGSIVIEPILMGVAIRVPHARDPGGTWLRIVVEMELKGDTIAVQVYDGKNVGGIDVNYTDRDLQRVQEAIFECARDVLVNPVRSIRGTSRIGFLDEAT
ncbi:hypothetical protein [Bradyrhizobium sp. 27S5]|uniref:hypothetical protein n=1 Tax=Bradyrhizobium sp. 27S5 TaxID=3139728 RepID=UPI0030CC15CD